MFDNRNPPPDDRQDGPASSVPILPPKRSFVLRRFNPNPTRDIEGRLVDVVEEVVIECHEVEFNAAGNILRFREYQLHPVEGPTNRVVRCFNGWLDYEERIIERNLITPVTLM